MVGTSHVKSPYKILVTSALPYVNNVPHMGNIVGSTLSADVFARYHRSQGNKVLYVCGTDEHGTATETRALEEGLTPRQLCDKYYAVHKKVYEWFDISFDVFGRTSAENHIRITQDIFLDLQQNGYIIEREVEQTYCETDKRFLADRFVEGECPHCHFPNARGDQCDNCGKLLDPLELIDPKCKICGNAPVSRRSNHLFLDLAKLQPKLEAWTREQAKKGEWTTNAITTTEGWLQRGLEPRAITRDLTWGVPVPVPGFEGKVFYVWFDAPIGYVSITGQKEGVDWREWWQDPQGTRLYQFMGKDNIPFHSILFPGTEIGTGKQWTMAHHIDAIEYLQNEDGKFSKSRRTGLFGDDAIQTGIPADVYRYYLLINRPETADTTFAWKDLQEKLNKELLANLGNLVNRTLVFIKNYQEAKVHESVLDEQSANFWEYVNEEEVQITDDLEHCREKDALRRIMTLSGRGNQYFQEQQPWKTRTDDPESCRKALFVLANLIKDIAVLIEPFLPSTSASIFKQLGLQQQKWPDLGNLSVKDRTIGEPSPLFAKLEDKQLDEIKAVLKGKNGAENGKAAGTATNATASLSGAVLKGERRTQTQERREGSVPSGRTRPDSNADSREQDGAEPTQDSAALKPLQLRAGKITEVKQHPNAIRLFIETVDFGDHTRTIVSGLVGHYTPEQLQGKTAIFVTNLAPANLRGVESQGMILAGQGAEKVEVILVDAPAGTVLDGMDAPEQITIDDFAKHQLTLRDHKVIVDGTPLTVKGHQVVSREIANGKVR